VPFCLIFATGNFTDCHNCAAVGSAVAVVCLLPLSFFVFFSIDSIRVYINMITLADFLSWLGTFQLAVEGDAGP